MYEHCVTEARINNKRSYQIIACIDMQGNNDMERLLLRPIEVAEVLGLSKNMVYESLKRGDIPGAIRIGRAVRVSRRALEEWIDGGQG